MIKSSDTEDVLACPHCGARIVSVDEGRPNRACWLCGSKIEPLNILDAPDESKTPEARLLRGPDRVSYSLSTMLLVMTLACICLGLLTVAPGLGVFVCVLLVPVFVRTMMVVRQRESLGHPVSRGQKMSLWFGSFTVAMVIVVVVAIASLGSFCAVCLTIYGVSESEETSILGALTVAAPLTLWILYVLGKWVRNRYRRDVGQV